MEVILIAALLICVIWQGIHLLRIRRMEEAWLSVLRSRKQGERDKIFVKHPGIMAEISYELNGILEGYDAQIAGLLRREEANKQILTSLSHDVRTPLASLLGYLGAIRDGIVSKEEKKEYLEVVYRKANDLSGYINMLFEWFKISSDEQRYHFEKTDINEATREIVIDWLSASEQHGAEIRLSVGEEELPISLDRMAYRRILDNLFQNAVTHGGCSEVSLSVRKQECAVQIELSNDGEPIPVDQLEHIFERLYKCDDSRSAKGSGLGLAIVKELVSVLHGVISVASEPGNTTFSVLLPLK